MVLLVADVEDEESVTNRKVQDAITALNSLQTNFAITEEIRKSQSRDDINKLSIPEAIEWLRRLGYQVCVPPYTCVLWHVAKTLWIISPRT